MYETPQGSAKRGWIVVNTVTELKMLSPSSEIKRGTLSQAGEMRQLEANLEFHLRKREGRFASLRYDIPVLSKKQ